VSNNKIKGAAAGTQDENVVTPCLLLFPLFRDRQRYVVTPHTATTSILLIHIENSESLTHAVQNKNGKLLHKVGQILNKTAWERGYFEK
jgi:hypothetical protein